MATISGHFCVACVSRNDAELACDEATIKRIGENERAGYGRTLIGMTCQKRPALLPTATTMTGSKSSIKERIMLIAKKPKTAIYTLVAVVLIAALATFIQALMSDATSAGVDISVEVDEKVPTAVIDYATDYVLQVVDSWNNGTPTDGGVVANVNKIIDAKITGLTQINTGTAALNHSINMYLLEYRLLPEDQDSIILAGGMQTELMDGQSWLTEWGSAGQPYLLFLCDENDNWTRICVTNTDVIEQDYGTLEMLEQYGNAYTAAAMELYEKYKDGENVEGGNDETPSPTAAVNSLFDSGEGVELTLNLVNDGVYNTYYASDWYAGRFKVLLNGYEWTELEMPSPEPSDFWLTAISTDGKQSVTFWADSGAGTVQYSSATGSTYWSAKPINEYSSSIAEDIRAEYDNLDVSYSRISFYLSGSAEDAAEAFVHSAYGSHMMNLAPGSMYGMSDYEVVDWDVREVSEDDSAVVGWFQCAFIPLDVDSPGLWAGNTSNGTGKYEGWLTRYREFVLQRQEDGYWHCIGFGTGGYCLPE